MQHAANGSCGKKSCAQRFVGGERVSDFNDASFGTLAMSLRFLVFLCALKQLPRGSMGLPGRHKNLESINNRQGFLSVFTGTAQVALRNRNSRLQVPSQGLQIRVGS